MGLLVAVFVVGVQLLPRAWASVVLVTLGMVLVVALRLPTVFLDCLLVLLVLEMALVLELGLPRVFLGYPSVTTPTVLGTGLVLVLQLPKASRDCLCLVLSLVG